MSDGIIDLTQYLQRQEDGERGGSATFALWGADGERSRFALPLWRTIYLAGGDRGGIVRLPADGSATPEPFVVLDLGSDPPRLDFQEDLTRDLAVDEAPSVRDLGGDGLAVYLGSVGSQRWYLVVDGRAGEDVMTGRSREDVLFMAGECAGLLFLRELAE